MPLLPQRIQSLCAVLASIIALTAADWLPPRALPVLRPGSPELDVSHIRERSDSTQYFASNAAHPESAKVSLYRHDEDHLIDDPRGPALLLVQSFRGYADSAIVLRANLRPILEVQDYFTRRRRIVYEYDRKRVHLRDSTADSIVRVRDHTYDGEFFHFNELGVVIRSLPLRAGYEAILPLYSEGTDTLEMDTVKVIGKDGGGYWTVRFADPVIVATHTIDGATRRIVSTSGGRREALKPAGQRGAIRSGTLLAPQHDAKEHS